MGEYMIFLLISFQPFHFWLLDDSLLQYRPNYALEVQKLINTKVVIFLLIAREFSVTQEYLELDLNAWWFNFVVGTEMLVFS